MGGLSTYQMKQFADYFEQAEHYENQVPPDSSTSPRGWCDSRRQVPPDWDNAIKKYEYCRSYTDQVGLAMSTQKLNCQLRLLGPPTIEQIG